MAEASLFDALIGFKPTGVQELDETMKYVQNKLGELGKSFGGLNMHGIGGAFGEAKEHLSQMLEMGKSFGLNVTEGLSSAFTSIAPQLASILSVPIVGEIAAGVAAVIALAAAGAGKEREHSRMDTLTGGEKQTTELFEGIQQNFGGTDVNVGQMQGMTKEMLAAGMSVEAINNRLKALGNVSLATGASVGGMQKALERMEATGKVNDRTLRSFGLGFEQEMAKARGISLATLREQAHGGQLHAKDVAAEVSRQGGEGGKGDTIRNAELNDVFGQLARMGHNLIEPFEKLGYFVIKTLNLGGALGVVNSIINVFGSAIGGVIAALTPIGELIGSVLSPIWTILSGVFEVVGTALELFGSAIGELLSPLKDIANCITAAIKTITNEVMPSAPLSSFSEEDKKESHRQEASWVSYGAGDIGDKYKRSLQLALNEGFVARGFDYRSLDELEKAVAEKKDSGEDKTSEATTGGGSMTSLTGLWDKIQEAAMKDNTAAEHLKVAQESNTTLHNIEQKLPRDVGAEDRKRLDAEHDIEFNW